MATAEPEGSSQGVFQALASTMVTFDGCNVAAIPSLTLRNIKAINYTTFSWTLNQVVTTSKGSVVLTPRANDSSTAKQMSSASATLNSSSSNGRPSAAATAAATAMSATPINVSASAQLAHKVPGVLVVPVGKDVSARVVVVSEISRLPGVDNGLFGLEGQLVASAPGKEAMEVAGEMRCVDESGRKDDCSDESGR